jgi:hypothetical protein
VYDGAVFEVKNEILGEMNWHSIGALRATASVFGVYAGLLGMEHGFFETLQGNVAPKGIRILAVGPPGLPFPFGHEPAMTLIPNFLVTGILAMIAGLLIIIWAAMFAQNKHGAVVLFLLSTALLLVGGGFGPITLLITACIAAATIDQPLVWWRSHLPANLRRFLAKLWPWSLFAALLWVPLEFTVGYIFAVKNDPKPSLTSINLILSYPLLVFFLLTLLFGFAHEVQRHIDLNQTGQRFRGDKSEASSGYP